MNWKSAIPSRYLRAADFEVPALMTIRGFSLEKIGD